MGAYYHTKEGYLTGYGGAADGQEVLGLPEGHELHLGVPEGYPHTAPPHAGAKWHVEQKKWVDTRNAIEQEQDVQFAHQAKRKAAYPPLSDFADALYWQSKGDDSLLKAYLLACDRVKQAFPKP